MDKKEIRRAMKRQNLELAAAERAEASACILAAAERLPEFSAARTVALFVSLPDELDTTQALECWARTKRIVVPRVEGDVMRFYEYDPTALEQGSFGIAEPTAAVCCDPSEIDLIVVPGTAFTRDGARMGRGKGYYDKYLSCPGFRAYKAGVCYPHQIVPELPVEPHDVPLDCVICGK